MAEKEVEQRARKEVSKTILEKENPLLHASLLSLEIEQQGVVPLRKR